MTNIEKNIKILKGLLPPDMKKDIELGQRKGEYISMLDIVLKTNRTLFMTKELYYELEKLGINTPEEMSVYIIERLYKDV